MIEVPIAVAENCRNLRVSELTERALREHEAATKGRQGELNSFHIDRPELSEALIESLRAAGESIGYESFSSALTVLQSIRNGKMRSIPNSFAYAESLFAYLELNFIDGWVYRRSDMGFLQAIRVDAIYQNASYSSRGFVLSGSALEVSGREFQLIAQTERKKGLPTTILGDLNLFRETAELKAEYIEQLKHLIEVAGNGSGHQCMADGIWTADMDSRELNSILNSGHNRESLWGSAIIETVRQRRVVIESIISDDVKGLLQSQIDSETVPERVGLGDEPAPNTVPISPLLQVFDLSGEGDRIISSTELKSYKYRENIRDQLVLPDSHSRVLDVLTSSTSSSLADVIHGKGAGNLVLCKGIPGVGKTLTAEIVAETLKRPMYTVDASSILGARSVREAMTAAFDRVRRWDGVLLLDEADVVIGTRGNDLERNRVTAELLRALESFERLAFLTTNRPEDVDDAILSRCVAIIEYTAPRGSAAKRAWMILADQLEVGFISEDLAEKASELFEAMPPRDIRQLLRLSFQIAKAEDRPLDLPMLEECAVFRAWTPPVAKG